MKRKFDDISDSHGNGTSVSYEEQPMEFAEKFVECLVQAQPDLIPKYDGMTLGFAISDGYRQIRLNCGTVIWEGKTL